MRGIDEALIPQIVVPIPVVATDDLDAETQCHRLDKPGEVVPRPLIVPPDVWAPGEVRRHVHRVTQTAVDWFTLFVGNVVRRIWPIDVTEPIVERDFLGDPAAPSTDHGAIEMNYDEFKELDQLGLARQ